jgi:hypothetical protein
MGEIHDVHHPEDDGQTQGHQGQDHTDQESRHQGTKKNVHEDLWLLLPG